MEKAVENQLGEALTRCLAEHLITQIADLVLDLALLPSGAGCRRPVRSGEMARALCVFKKNASERLTLEEAARSERR